MKTLNRYFVTVLICIGLMSCGYHLRGQTQIPQQAMPVYLSSDSLSQELMRVVASQLDRNKVVTTEDKTLASTIILIASVNKSENVISVDSFGRTSAIKLITTVDFYFTINKIRYKKQIRVFKDLSFNPKNILSFEKESKTLYQEMFVDVSRLMLQQLQAKTKHAF